MCSTYKVPPSASYTGVFSSVVRQLLRISREKCLVLYYGPISSKPFVQLPPQRRGVYDTRTVTLEIKKLPRTSSQTKSADHITLREKWTYASDVIRLVIEVLDVRIVKESLLILR